MNKATIFAGVTALVFLTGCGTKDNSTASQPKEVKLRVSWWGGNERHDQTLKAIKLFEEKNPHIKISSEYGGWQGWAEKFMIQMGGGTAPDLMQVNWNWLDIYSRNGDGFYDLNKLSSIIDLSQYDKELLEQCSPNGVLNAVPIGINGRTFFYNKTTYAKAGISIPSNFDEVIAAAPILKKQLGNDYYPLVLSNNGAIFFMLYKLEQETGKPFIVDNKIAYTSSQIKSAAEYYMKLIEDRVIPSPTEIPGYGTNVPPDQHQSWITGKFGGVYEWDSAIAKMRDGLEKGQSLQMGEFPTNFGSYNSAFVKVSMGLAINKNTKYPKETAQLLNFLVSDPEAVQTLGVSRGIVANKKAIKILEENNIAEEFMVNANKKVIEFKGKGIHPHFEHMQLQSQLRDSVERLGYGKTSPEDMANEWISSVNSFLEANS